MAVEIVAPEQHASALVRRRLRYVELGVRIALLVDPADQSVVAFRPGQAPQPLRRPDWIDLDDVLPGFRLRAQELFDALGMR